MRQVNSAARRWSCFTRAAKRGPSSLKGIHRLPSHMPARQSSTDTAGPHMFEPITDGDVPTVVSLMNRAYRGSGTSAGWTKAATIISGDRTSEALVRADLASKPNASFLKWVDPASRQFSDCVWLEEVDRGTWFSDHSPRNSNGRSRLGQNSSVRRRTMDRRTRRQSCSDHGRECP